jgi:CheY-like chemotaxis protein
LDKQEQLWGHRSKKEEKKHNESYTASDDNDIHHYSGLTYQDKDDGSNFAFDNQIKSSMASSSTTTVDTKQEKPFLKRILVVDDDPDLTLTFKVGLEEYYEDINDKIIFEVYTYNDPLLALSQFKPHFYDLLLTDIYMPDMNGFELCQKILELDIGVRVCFISSAELNIQALREVYPTLGLGCFIKKPVSIEYLIKRLSAELE